MRPDLRQDIPRIFESTSVEDLENCRKMEKGDGEWKMEEGEPISTYVQCDECDKWRILTATAFKFIEKLSANVKFSCADVKCSCDTFDDADTENVTGNRLERAIERESRERMKEEDVKLRKANIINLSSCEAYSTETGTENEKEKFLMRPKDKQLMSNMSEGQAFKIYKWLRGDVKTTKFDDNGSLLSYFLENFKHGGDIPRGIFVQTNRNRLNPVHIGNDRLRFEYYELNEKSCQEMEEKSEE